MADPPAAADTLSKQESYDVGSEQQQTGGAEPVAGHADKFENGEKEEIKDDKDKKKKNEKVAVVPLYQLFSFADRLDYLLMFLGALGAIGLGASQPGMILLFGSALDAFGETGNFGDVTRAVQPVMHRFQICLVPGLPITDSPLVTDKNFTCDCNLCMSQEVFRIG